jgi:hypothetical protein
MEITAEQAGEASATVTAYYSAAKTCKQGVDADCAKEAALAYAMPAAAGCGSGDVSECAKMAAINGATSVCTAYTGGAGAPVCAWAASEIVEAVWPYAESAVAYAGKVAGGVGAYVLDFFGIMDQPSFASMGVPALQAAQAEFNRLKTGWSKSMVESILKTRRDLGSSDTAILDVNGVINHEWKSTPVSIKTAADEALRLSLRKTVREIEHTETMTDGSGSWFVWGAPMMGYLEGTKGLVTDRAGKFKWAMGQIANGITRDMNSLKEAMHIATGMMLAVEANNPSTRLARVAKKAKKPPSLNVAMQQVFRKAEAERSAKAAADALSAKRAIEANKRKIVIAAGLAAVAAGVVFALASD